MSAGPRTGRRVACAWLAAACMGGAARAGAECEAWPGEPTPLPSVADPDSARARWAELRLADVSARAERLEPVAPLESQRLWQRALCLDPTSERAQHGVRRSLGVRVHRPPVAWGAPSVGPDDPWQLGAAIAIAPPPPSSTEAASAPQPEPAEVARAAELLAATQTSLSEARFEEALGRAFEARSALDRAGAGAAADALRIRVAVAAATAQLALGDERGARESLGEALRVEPGLALDPGQTSPKVLRALEAARAAAGGAP